MPICYEIDIDFNRGDEGHEGETSRVPFQIKTPAQITFDELEQLGRNSFSELVQRITGSDPSRAPYFGDFAALRVLAMYEC